MKIELEKSATWDPVIYVLAAACFVLAGVELGLQMFLLR